MSSAPGLATSKGDEIATSKGDEIVGLCLADILDLRRQHTESVLPHVHMVVQ